MAKKQAYVYNEHDRSQVQAVLEQRKKKKRKKVRRRVFFILFLILMAAYFISDISKTHTIDIEGNSRILTQTIKDATGVKENSSIHLFQSTNTIEDKVKKVPGIKDVTVSKTLGGNITVRVNETTIIAFSKIGEKMYSVDEKGKVLPEDSAQVLEEIQHCPQVFNMSEENLKKFAKEYSQVPSQVRNQISEILLDPGEGSQTRCRLNMDNGKVLYIRIEDLSKLLAGDRYAKILQQDPNGKYYHFLGKNNVYITDEEKTDSTTSEDE